MEEVDVDKMENEHEEENYRKEMIKNIIKQRKEIEQIPKEDKKKKIKKAIEGFKVTMPRGVKINKKEDEEVFNSFKNSILEVLVTPMKAPEKKPKFKKRLMDSEYCNNYLKSSLYDKYLRHFNPNIKFAMVYGYHYANTMLEFDDIKPSAK